MKWISATPFLPILDPIPTAELLERFAAEDAAAARRAAINAEIDRDRLQNAHRHLDLGLILGAVGLSGAAGWMMVFTLGRIAG